MPRKQSHYENTIIYKIYCKDAECTHFYIGHSTNFILRKNVHKFYSKTKNSNLYKYIRENGGWENFVMEKIDDFPCETKREAHQREREFIECLEPELNENVPLRTYKELRLKNKEKYNLYMKEYMKKYYRTQKAKKELEHKEIKKDFVLSFD